MLFENIKKKLNEMLQHYYGCVLFVKGRYTYIHNSMMSAKKQVDTLRENAEEMKIKKK